MRALVTGGAGFIGSHLVRRLLATGHEVRVIDNLATGRLSNLDEVIGDIEFFELDIRDAEGLRAPMAGCDTVIHVAALPSVPRSIADPVATHEANATGTLNVLIAARDAGVARVVLASSSSIYGATRELPKRESLRRCRSRRTPSRSWRRRATAAASSRSTGSRPSRCATSTSSARARTRTRSTRP